VESWNAAVVTSGADGCFAVTVGESTLRQRSTWAWLEESPAVAIDLVEVARAVDSPAVAADLVLVFAAASKALDEDWLSRSGLAWYGVGDQVG
jgi:hypothetical protein